MSEHAQQNHRKRVPLGALIDQDQRDKLAQLARQRDCSVSRIVRQALRSELARETGGTRSVAS
jgi:predicted transcriptional regulator